MYLSYTFWEILVFGALRLRTLFGLLNIVDSSVAGKSFEDEARVWRKCGILILVSVIGLFAS